MTYTTQIREGGCQCGGVRYRISGAPEGLIVCHCSECQRQSASAFGMSLILRRDHFTLLKGELRDFNRVADSGRTVSGHFCPGCGVRIYHSSAVWPEHIRLRPGTLDDRSWLKPDKQIWMRSRQPWLDTLPEIAGFPQQA